MNLMPDQSAVIKSIQKGHITGLKRAIKFSRTIEGFNFWESVVQKWRAKMKPPRSYIR